MYKVQEVAKIAGVSVRTLHHYDSIGLMKPSNIGSNRYRYYNDEDLKLLQHILFFKEIGFSLKKIQELVAEGFDPEHSLAQHGEFLRQKQERLERLIENAEMTLREFKGLETLTNEQRFSAFTGKNEAENINNYKAAIKQEAPKVPVAAGGIEIEADAVFSEDSIVIKEIGLTETLEFAEELTMKEETIIDETSSAAETAASESISLPENSTSIEKTEAIEETAPAEESPLEDEAQVEEVAPQKEAEDLEEINREGNRIYTTVASLMHLSPETAAVQKEMEAYYILLNRFYNCNPKMFRGLGDLYAADSRFSNNIDQHGAGLSKYLKDAMYLYAESIENA
ncbi:DNA-binding transcriptional MerR regulator [Planomicrobium soli]|uniref:DNA-binding transcriptional MerR regulator n=1 Tax=Planomicrobium soli TaxID=1176648 RepID=A0A2P8FTK9_9BACL|nr:MerR family transcriptional regulator [Planomicrobium soli]PSL25067.1 DNA-binding transcriptional MerR regulator [Planomicrobium soli]